MDAPTNLSTSLITSSSITLSWDAVVDADYYKVYLDDVLVDGNVSTTSFEFTPLIPNTSYTLGVSAVELVEEEEVESEITEEEETTDELLAPTNVTASATDRVSATLDWDAATYADHYEVYQDGVLVDDNVSAETYEFTELEDGITYVLGVIVVDDIGNKSELATDSITIDTVNPITGLVASNVRFTTFDIAWVASGEASTYNIYLNNVLLVNTANTFYSFNGLNKNTLYKIGITAIDSDDIESTVEEIEVRTLKGKTRSVSEDFHETIYEDLVSGKLFVRTGGNAISESTLVTTSDIGAVNDTWKDQGAVIDMRGYTELGLEVTLDVNDSTGNQLQILSGMTNTPTAVLEEATDYQKTLGNADGVFFYKFVTDGLIPYLKLQTKATVVGATEGTVTIKITKK